MGNSIGTPPETNNANSSSWQNPVYIFGDSVCVCSGQGTCNSAGVCICNPGYTGASDFINAANVQCHISSWAIKGLWIFNLTLLNLLMLYSVPKVLKIYNKFQKSRKKMKARGKNVVFTSHKGLMVSLVLIFYLYPLTMITGLLEIFDEQRLIGIDPFITITWMLGRSATYIQLAIHQPSLARRLLKAENATHDIIDRSSRTLILLGVIAAMSGLWALPILITQGQDIELARGMFAAFCFSQCVTFGLYSFAAHKLKVLLKEILNKSFEATKDPNVLVLRDKIAAAQTEGSRQAGIQVFLFGIYLAAPPLWLTHRYLLPISWLAPIILNKRVIDSIYLNDEKTEHTATTNHKRTPNNSSLRTAENNHNRVGDSTPFASPPAAYTEHDEKQMFASSVVEIENEHVPALLSTGSHWKD